MSTALIPSYLLAGILCFAAACSRRADDPIAIRKAAAKTQTSEPVRLNYVMRTFGGDYTRVGRRSPVWDPLVTSGFSAFARGRVLQNPAENASAWTNLNEAVRLGCDDPLVLYTVAHLKYGDASHADKAQAAEWVHAAEGILASDYSHLRKGWAAFRAGEALEASTRATNLTAEVVQWRNNTYNECAAMLAEESPPPPEDACTLIKFYLRKTGRKAYTSSFDLLWPPLHAKYPKSADAWLIRGKYYIDYAWQARGGGYANTVSASAWKLFSERLDLAQEALEKSWKFRPMEETAIQSLRLELGQGKGKQRMEKFFQRAMLLNSNSWDACHEKLFYLFPRWYGSPEAMLQFAWECVNSKSWGGNVPLIMLDAQDELARLADPDGLKQQEWKNYWTRPEVWPAVQSAFTKYFQLNPQNTSRRQNQFWYACQCERWDIASELLPQLGKINYSYFGGREVFERMAAETRSRASSHGN